MVEIFKYTSLIEEQLLKNDFQNTQIKNIIVDSFILGHLLGGQRDSRVKFSEFQRSLEVVQQLRNLIEINALKNEQIIELYNNVFINYEDIQELYTMIELQLFDQNDDFNQKQFPIEQQNFNTQKKAQNQVTNEQKNFRSKNQFPKFVPFETQFQQSEDINCIQNFDTLNQFAQINNIPYQQPQQQQINQNEFEPINQFPQAFINQLKKNPFKNQKSQITFQYQPCKYQESQNKEPLKEQFQEKLQNQNQFSNSDTFIINEMRQIRDSETKLNNQNQQQELRKIQNIARIQQQFPVAHNFQMKVQQNQKVQIEQEQDQNKELEQYSIFLAQKLQLEFDQEDQFQIKYDFTKDCDICFVKLDLEQMMVLDCGHIFHLNCLNQTCLTQMQSRQFPIYCPNQYCKKTPIIYNDLAKILDKVNLELYQQLTFQSYIDSHGDEYSWCPTPDCQFVFISEGNNHFQCPVCSKQYCLNCKAEFHNGQTCQQYMSFKNMNKEDQQFYQFVQGAKFKQCPKCKFWVEKNEGCNHMTCRCRFEFCYTCGQDYKQQCKCKDNYHFHRNSIFQNIPRYQNNQF